MPDFNTFESIRVEREKLYKFTMDHLEDNGASPFIADVAKLLKDAEEILVIRVQLPPNLGGTLANG